MELDWITDIAQHKHFEPRGMVVGLRELKPLTQRFNKGGVNGACALGAKIKGAECHKIVKGWS